MVMASNGCDKMGSMNRLVLVDGHAILYRAFHALPPLTTSEGAPINAVYGFVRMLLKVISNLKPTHLAVAFDRPKPTFRKKLFDGYQAQRPKTPDDLVSQIGLVHKVLETMEIPIYEKDGFEADDVIGSLAFQAKNLKLKAQSSKLKLKTQNSKLEEIIIVTGDRDILQLVGKKTKVYMPIKGLSQAKLYGVEEVEEKFGIKPEQIVDFKALIGDPSDNYPGVMGIGPKTATQLLNEFGSLDKIFDKKTHVRQFVNEKVFRALKQDKDQAELAKKLAKIVTDVPVTLELEKARLGKLDTPKTERLFAKLEFKSLIPRLAGKESDKKAVAPRSQKETEDIERSKQLSLI